MEINKCLEDPNTQYSDQYMPLAMMPAVVEAIQNAGGGGFPLITEASETGTLNKTAAELIAMLESGSMGLIVPDTNTAGSEWSYQNFLSSYIYDERGGYQFGTMTGVKTYVTNSLDGYPVDDSF